MTPFETPSDRKNKKTPENTWNSLNTYQKMLLLTTTLFTLIVTKTNEYRVPYLRQNESTFLFQ